MAVTPAKGSHMDSIDELGFEWPVCTDGYEWRTRPTENGDPHGEPVEFKTAVRSSLLKQRQEELWRRENAFLQPRSSAFTVTRPLHDNPNLFIEFSELSVEPTSIIEFAGRHGALLDLPYQRPRFSDLNSYELWSLATEEMRLGLELWKAMQALEDGDRSPFEAIIDSSGDYLRPADERFLPLYTGVSLESDGLPKPRGRAGLLRVASKMLERLMNTGQWYGPEDRSTRPTRVTYRRSGNRFYRQWVPTNLLAALWFQFGNLITEETLLFYCLGCRRYAVRACAGHRDEMRHCSGRCRVRVHRMKEKARALRAEGMSKPKIASELAVPTSAIKEWLAPNPR
jgi:hypothetical protein